MEPTPLGPPGFKDRTIDREKFEGLLDEYYEVYGWDRNGVPKSETLVRLGLDQEPSHII